MLKVDQTKMAEILGVSQKSISRAIERGRLTRSVRKLANGRYSIEVATAVLEWHQNADLSKDRGGYRNPLVPVEDLMEQEDSRRLKNHYEALAEKLGYEKDAGEVISFETVKKEVFEAARAARERLQTVAETLAHPLAAEKEPSSVRRILSDEIRKALEEVTRSVE